MKTIMRLSLLACTILILASACQSAVTATPEPPATASASETPSVPATVELTSMLTPIPNPTATSPGVTKASEPSTSTPVTDDRGNADVVYVRAVQTNDGTWTFHVTVQHRDTGWEDYADGWDVVTPDGTVLKTDPDDPFTRLLLHPHENEQPFTRSQSGVEIPDDVTQVRVRAHDLVDGYGGREVMVDLTVGSGTDFEVQR
jgi:hypothetical protein